MNTSTSTTNTNTSSTNTNTNTSTLTYKGLKATRYEAIQGVVLADFLSASAVSLAESLFTQGAKFAPLCATLAGVALEWVMTGNDGPYNALVAVSDSGKGVNKARLTACLNTIGQLPKGKTPTMAYIDAVDYCIDKEAEFLAIFGDIKPRKPGVSYKALYQECLKSRDAALQEITRLQGEIARLTA